MSVMRESRAFLYAFFSLLCANAFAQSITADFSASYRDEDLRIIGYYGETIGYTPAHRINLVLNFDVKSVFYIGTSIDYERYFTDSFYETTETYEIRPGVALFNFTLQAGAAYQKHKSALTDDSFLYEEEYLYFTSRITHSNVLDFGLKLTEYFSTYHDMDAQNGILDIYTLGLNICYNLSDDETFVPNIGLNASIKHNFHSEKTYQTYGLSIGISYRP